jgi:hypothetical protein
VARAAAATRPFRVRPAILVLAAVCLLGWFSTEIGDTDFWWHLKTGDYILAHRALPLPDPFSFTAGSAPPAYSGEERTRRFNLTHEWLAQVAWSLTYRTAGVAGVVLLKALLLAAFCGLCGYLAARRSGSFYWGLAGAFAAAPVASLFTADRPALVTFLMVAVFLAILETRRGLWLLPPLSLIWANCHGGFFLGWVVLGAYSAEAVIGRFRGRPEPGAPRLWTVTALSVLLSGLNPNHFRVVEVLALYRRSFLTSTLIEWTRPPLWGPPYSFQVLLYSAAAVLALAWRRVRPADWLLFAAFAAASLLAFRNVMLIALFAPIAIATYFPWKRRLPALAGPAAAALLAATLAFGIARGSFFQLRAALWKFPSGAADFLLAHRISGPLFNTYEHGGYLIWRLWPQQRVFIDGRALDETVYRDYRQVLYNFGANPAAVEGPRAAALDRYGIQAIVMNAFEYVTGAMYPLALALADPASEWKLVYEEPQAMVFLRGPADGTPTLDPSRVFEHLESECRLVIDNDPELCLCARTLGDFFLRTGHAAGARRMLGLYLAHRPGPDPEAERAYRSLLFR